MLVNLDSSSGMGHGLHTVLESSSDIVAIVNTEGVFVSINQAATEILGYPREALIGKKSTEFIAPKCLEASLEARMKVLAGEKVIDFENCFKHRDGHEVYISWSAYLSTEEQMVYAIGRNITGRREASEKISESEKKYRSLFEQASDAIMITDFNGNFKEVNSSLCKMFGYDSRELLEMNVRDLLEPEQLKQRPIRFDMIMEGQHMFNERAMQHRDGRIIHVEANVKKFSDENIVAIARDITERKKAEEAMRQSEERYKALVDDATEALAALQKSEANLKTIFDTTETIYAMTDENLRILSYNHAALRFAKSELGLENPADLNLDAYFRSDRKEAIKSIMSSVLQGKSLHYEADYLQKDGSVHWYDVRLNPIKGEEQQVIGLMLSMDDISERKLQEEYANSQIQLLKELSYITSHELRHEYVKLHGVVNLIMDLEHADKEIQEIVSNSLEIFDKLEESIVKLNDKITGN